MYHFQRTVTDWPRAVAQLPPGSLIKAVDQGDILRDAKAINPGVTTMLRHVGGPQTIFWGDLEANKQLARDFFETFIDETFRRDYAAHTDLVQEWNEYVDQWHAGEELQKRLTWAEAVAWVWQNEYRTQPEYSHIRLALLSWPVGNNVDRRFAEIALSYDCVLSYHPYDKYLALNQRDPGSWQYHCGRWHFLEQAWGLKPDWVFGEAGPYEGVRDGWRSDKVLGGDRDAYVEAVRRWIREMKATPAYQEGRIKGFALFTTGRTEGGWGDYYTEQPELDMLAAMIREEWAPVAPPPPPPPPEEDDMKAATRRLIWNAGRASKRISVSPKAALGGAIKEHEMWPQGPEADVIDEDGVRWRLQLAKVPDSDEQMVFACEVPKWGTVYVLDGPEEFSFEAWPTTVRRVTQRFAANPDAYRKYGLPGHEGIDLASPYGSPYYCVAPGTVIWASDRRRSDNVLSAYGWHVIIDHGNGYTTLYAHAQVALPVAVGERLDAGDVVAYSGNTGNSSGAHLHLTIKKEGYQLDGWPAGFVDPTPFIEKFNPTWP